jgi:DegT/DnrJ/EryC1/StrS aminotransferase family
MLVFQLRAVRDAVGAAGYALPRDGRTRCGHHGECHSRTHRNTSGPESSRGVSLRHAVMDICTTPHAARAAGVTPGFHDVDRRYWTLNPEGVLETLKHISRPLGAVMVVSPFGAPIDIQAWECFEDRTGIPVVVDAAAGFDTARVSRIPLVVSCMRPKFWERARAASSPPRTRSCWTACGCAATSASKTRAWRCCHHSMPK